MRWYNQFRRETKYTPICESGTWKSVSNQRQNWLPPQWQWGKGDWTSLGGAFPVDRQNYFAFLSVIYHTNSSKASKSAEPPYSENQKTTPREVCSKQLKILHWNTKFSCSLGVLGKRSEYGRSEGQWVGPYPTQARIQVIQVVTGVNPEKAVFMNGEKLQCFFPPRRVSPLDLGRGGWITGTLTMYNCVGC